MAPNTITTLDISGFAQRFSAINATICTYYGEACSVAFFKNGHNSETIVEIDGDRAVKYSFKWQIPNIAGWEDNDVVAENAAYCIAFFLAAELTEFTAVSRSEKGTGFDFWLGYPKGHPNYDPYNFMLARLEVSGIFSGTDAARRSRVSQKKVQTSQSARLRIPAFVSVTEFGKCKSTFSKV